MLLSGIVVSLALIASAAAATEGSGAGAFNAKDALLTPDLALTLATWLCFLVLVGLLKKFGWGPFMKALEDREAAITASVERAEAAKREAEKLLSDYTQKLASARAEADRMIGEARDNASKTAARITEDGRKAAEEAMTRATHSIEAERQKAVAALNRIVADAAVSLASRILREEIDPARHRNLIETAIKDIRS